MTLYLIRHAHAGQGNPNDPEDHTRPLSRKGQKQGETLAQLYTALGVRFDRLFSSPYPRAAETAKALAVHVRGGRLETLDELTGSDHEALLNALRGALKTRDRVAGLVGHEPYLSELTSYLLTGDADALTTRFRKAMTLRLEGTPKSGAMTLHSALPLALAKQLAAPNVR